MRAILNVFYLQLIKEKIKISCVIIRKYNHVQKNFFLLTGIVFNDVECMDICNENHQVGVQENMYGLYPCLGFNLKR